MTWAVHSIHSPATRLIDGGMTHDGKTVIPLPVPIDSADTFDEAESWRLARVEQWKDGVR